MKIRQMIAGIICIVIIIGGAVLLKTFIIGSLESVDIVPLNHISVSDTEIALSGELQASALAYKGFKYRIDGETMYVRVYSVVVSSFHKYGTIQIGIDGDFSNINKIYVEDSDNQRLIWDR
jgi:hypothetical protein